MDDIERMLELDYYDCVNILRRKYGDVADDYFYREPFTGNLYENKDIKRTWNGLKIHHIDEDKEHNLSKHDSWLSFPEYQKADRLIYCNLTEHLLLHIKIYELNRKRPSLNGVFLLVRKINYHYSMKRFLKDKEEKMYKEIKYIKLAYFKCLKYVRDNKIWSGAVENKWWHRTLDDAENYDEDLTNRLYKEIDDYIFKGIKPEPETDIPLLEFLLNIFSNKTNDSNISKFNISRESSRINSNKNSLNNSSNNNHSNNENGKCNKYHWLWLLILVPIIVPLIIFLLFYSVI